MQVSAQAAYDLLAFRPKEERPMGRCLVTILSMDTALAELTRQY